MALLRIVKLILMVLTEAMIAAPVLISTGSVVIGVPSALK